MRRTRFVARLYLVAFFLLFAVAMTMSIAHHASSARSAELERDLTRRVTALARDITSFVTASQLDLEALRSRVAAAAATGVEISVTSPEGELWATTRHGEAPIERAFTVRTSIPSSGGAVVAFVHGMVSLPAGGHGIVVDVIVNAVVALAASGLIVLLLVRRMLSPIAALVGTARSVAVGEQARKVSETGSLEVDRLITAFNSMADEVRARSEALSRDRDKLRTVLAGMAEGVVAVDKEGRVLYMNEMAGQLLETSPADSVGRRVWEVVRVSEVSELLATTLRDGSDNGSEVRLLNSGRDRVVFMHASPLREAAGAASGAVVVLQDITELRRLEAVRRDFVANVSHELKTPITAIRGFAEALVDEEEMALPTQRRFFERILSQAVRLSDLVIDLLTLSRLESREGVLEMKPLDLKAVLLSCVQGILPAEERTVEVVLDLPPDPVMVNGDDQTLRLVFNNLLDNARKYTPPGGHVTARLRVDGRSAAAEITDTGIGIEPKHLDRIFERFYRVDKARSRDLGGTGLGLSIVKHICIAHGGDVSVESTPGRGSTFRVRLPLATANHDETAREARS